MAWCRLTPQPEAVRERSKSVTWRASAASTEVAGFFIFLASVAGGSHCLGETPRPFNGPHQTGDGAQSSSGYLLRSGSHDSALLRATTASLPTAHPRFAVLVSLLNRPLSH